jgi:hypothetical protein
MEFSRADSRVKMWFSDVSGADDSHEFWFYQTNQHTLKMGKELAPGTSGILHILTRLSA